MMQKVSKVVRTVRLNNTEYNVAVRACDGLTLYGTTCGGGSSAVSWVLPGKIRPHAMLVIVVEACKLGREGSGQ